MAFGSIVMEERAPRPVKAKPVSTPVREVQTVTKEPAAPSAGGRKRLEILLVGRNLALMQEFLCSMNQNMGEALSGQGLAFYTQELASISDIIEKKKRLEQYCWSFSDADWRYPEGGEASRTYTFSISPAGSQGQALDLVIRCVTPRGDGTIPGGQADGVWLLSDGALLYDERDDYLVALQDMLDGLSGKGENAGPVCLILSQIERLGHFDGPGALSLLPPKVSARVTALCRERFSAGIPVALIPVQVYGGMECAGLDEKHDPLLRIGQNSFYQSYVPDNCQIPCLYTIQAICAARNTDYFADTAESGMMRGIRGHYGSKFGNPQWAPEMLQEKEEQ